MQRTLFSLISIAFSLLSYGAVSPVQVGDPARQQGVVTFRVNDPNQCTLSVYRDSGLVQKVDDTNNSVFTGSESCARPNNVVEGNRVTAVIGKRTSELASDGKLHSRSLEVNWTYYVVITDLTDNAIRLVSFTTLNIPWGDTHIEEVPYSDSGFNHWAYPDLDWTDAGANQSYVDPVSGVSFKRAPRNMEGKSGSNGNDPNTELVFNGVFDIQSAWTNAQNALSNSAAGPFASYSGTNRSPLFMPFRHDTPVSGSWDVYNYTWEDVRVNVYGFATGSNVEDRKVLLCLGANYTPATDTCTNEIEVTLPNSAGKVQAPTSYPTFAFSGWQLGRPLTSGEAGVPSGTATVAGSVVTLTGGLLPPTTVVGTKINIGGTWYTIGTLGTASSFTLAESNVTASGTWYTGAFGVHIRKKTATNNQINVAATFSLSYSQNPHMAANGVRDLCSTLTFTVDYAADGITALSPTKKGRMCFDGSNMFLLADDGETRFLAALSHADNSWNGVSPSIPLGGFSQLDPYTIIGIHTDDSGQAGLPARSNTVFYEIKYDPSSCHFKTYVGNAYSTITDPVNCVTWTNKTPYTNGNTVSQQLASALASNPIWDNTMNAQAFHMVALSGRWAVLNQFTSFQDNPCIMAVFDMTTYTLVKVFDSFSGSLPGLRYAGCHLEGLDVPYGSAYGFGGMSLLYAKQNPAYLSGPFLVQSITAKSLDGGATWTSNTSLTNVQAANCGSNSFGITGLQCVKLKLSSDKPCNMNAPGSEAGKWPCPWHSGYSNPLGMSIDVGDYFSRVSSLDGTQDVSVDGKNEKFRVLTKTPDGSGGWIYEVQRWSACDNINSDLTQGAVMYYDHLGQGSGNATHINGWKALVTATQACSGTGVWINLSQPLASTNIYFDNTSITQSHNTFGLAPDGTSFLQVGPGTSRFGTTPGIFGVPQQFNFMTDSSSFAGLTRAAGGQVEAYPSLSNWQAPTRQRRSLYWDFRHINPNTGTSPGALTVPFGQTYSLVTGQKFTYKVNSYQDVGSYKERAPNAFGTAGAFKDISSPATGDVVSDTNLWSYCRAYKATECRATSVKGDIYVVAPNANIGSSGCNADTYTTYTPCVTPLWSNAGWMIEGDSQSDDPLGYRFRRITMGMSGPAAQYQYTSPHMLPDSSFALLRAGYPNGVRPDMLVIKMPAPAATDSIDRTNYVAVANIFPAGSGYVRIRFGYAENGPVGNFYCTSRQEACVTDSAVAPFAYAPTDALTATDCRTGCTIRIPALSGRVLYYRVEKSKDGATGWVNGSMQVKAVK